MSVELVVLGACAAAVIAFFIWRSVRKQQAAPAVSAETRRRKVALALGGGAARGFAHVGVIRTLEMEKVPIDLIVGTSVGSLIGALYAHHRNSFELEATAFSLERDDIFDWGVLGAFKGMGLVKGERLEEFVRKKVPVRNIEELATPFAAVATDLNRGTRVVLDKGPLDRAVRISCALPGVFQPVEHEGRLLVDGGVIEAVPAATARDLGAEVVIAVDIGKTVENFAIDSILDVVLQAYNIESFEKERYKKREADVLISPQVGDIGILDFSQKKRCMEAGIEATRAVLPEIRKLIGDRK